MTKKTQNNAGKSKTDKNAPLKWIISVSKPHLSFVLLLVVLYSVAASLGTISALTSKEIIDSAVNGVVNRLIVFCAIYLGIIALQIGLNILLRYLTEKCHARLDLNFKRRLFAKQLNKKYTDIRAYHSGDLVNRLTGDVNVITDAVTGIVPNIASIAVRLICAFSVLLYMQKEFALVFAIGGLIIYVITRFLREHIKSLHRDMQKADGRVRSYWQEILENLLVIKSFSAEKRCNKKSDELLDAHYSVRMKKAALGAVSSGANHAVMRIGYIFALVWCAFCLLNKKMSFGSLTAITSLVGQVQQPFQSLSGIMPRYYAAISSAERIMEIESLPDEPNPNPENQITNVKSAYSDFKCIRVNDVTFAYDTESIIENVNLIINKGDFVSITGASGIGKSTLFKLLLNIYSPDSGEIDFVFDKKTVKLCPEMRKLFAYVPQGNMLLSGTVRENLEFMADNKDDKSIYDALKITCCNEFLNSMPNGLETYIGEGGLGLSEGQIQRIAVARALLSDAPILLLDEATSALDEKTEAKMLENLHTLTDKTCFIVTHKRAALEICNRHLHMENKYLQEADLPDVLKI